jgi:hypothetical protein
MELDSKKMDRIYVIFINECLNFRIRIYINKAGGEMISFFNLNQKGIILGLFYPKRKKLFQHDRDLNTIRGSR